MSINIQNTRGDINLIDQNNIKEGQLIWSFKNTDVNNSLGHTYSDGQLWIKEPSGLLEVSNRRSIDSLNFKGYIDESFNGDFTNANEVTQQQFKRCHVGDFFIFSITDKNNYKIPFYKGDILLITDTQYSLVENQLYRDILTSVDYIRIPGSQLDTTLTDLDTDNIQEAISKLELRLFYCGDINTIEEFNNLIKKKGGFYLFKNSDISIDSSLFDLNLNNNYEGRLLDSGFIKFRYNDIIVWNGEKWNIISTGLLAKDISYTPNSDEIDNIDNFDSYIKIILKSSKSLQEAIDILNINKAPLDKNYKIPFSVLPESITTGLSMQGKFYPIIDISKDPNDSSNQNNWPEPIDLENNLLEKWRSGWFYIVDTQNIKNVQYKDPLISSRTIELNTGDWIVWVEKLNRFEVIDNSDRVSSIDVYKDDTNYTSLLGSVGFKSTSDKLSLRVSDNIVEISTDGEVITQDPTQKGRKNYFSKYSDNNYLTNSHLKEIDDSIISEWNFQIGESTSYKILSTYGDLEIKPTVSNTNTGFTNHSINFITSIYDSNKQNYTRTTSIKGSTLRNLTNDNIYINLPEASSTLLGILKNDYLSPNYTVKTNSNGFITDSLNSEIIVDNNDVLSNNFENGYYNVGIGRSVSEDIDTGEITFYSKSTDNDVGFYTRSKNIQDPLSNKSELIEHLLNRDESKTKTSLKLNTYNLNLDKVTINYLPYSNGSIITWEEIEESYGNGKTLTIPVWEDHSKYNRNYKGLSSSPISIKINRSKSGNETYNRKNNLNEDYGEGLKSTWSYIGSNKIGSLQDEEQSNKSDVVSFDSWIESQRSIATKEAFILPSTSQTDDDSKMNNDSVVTESNNTSKKTEYLKKGKGGSFTRILPSRTVFKNADVYYDAFGNLIEQDKVKDVELPAESGVLLTNKSVIRCKEYLV